MSRIQLAALHVHPVKSVAGIAPDEMAVEPWGPAGDRRWAVIDADHAVVTQRQQPRLALATAQPLGGGRIKVTGPGLDPLEIAVPEPTGTVPVEIFGKKIEAVAAATSAHDWFSEYLGARVRLVHLDAPEHRRQIDPRFSLPGETVSLADGFPLLVASISSLDSLNSLIAQGDHAFEGPLPMNRFRPNVVVSGSGAWAEDEWRRISIGEITFRVARTCGRCVVTTTDQHSAQRGKEPLRTLARHRRIDGRLVFGQNLIPEHTGVLRLGDEVRVLQ
ncbi:MOSC domain-containing protein [Streptomyces sp. NPDC006879]|uniref:MOSC domain-containing protein n=1 Tax=Streptomyces sp. NPDC006879 TaxID=3364767 RepID=UPI0036B027AA